MTRVESPSSLQLTELEKMIGRAERACDRYRQAAAERGLSPPTLARRLQALQRMEGALARLHAQHHGSLGPFPSPGIASSLRSTRAAPTQEST